MFSSSSSTRHEAHEASDRMNRSLNLGVTSACASVRNRACASMLIAYSWRSESIDLRSSTTCGQAVTSPRSSRQAAPL